MSDVELDVECANHSEMKAVDVCEVCGKPVCGDCAIPYKGKVFCDETAHQKIYEDYLFFAEAANMFDIELVAKNLQANGVMCVWFNPIQYGFETLPRLFVLKESVNDAQKIVNSLDLSDFIIMKSHVE